MFATHRCRRSTQNKTEKLSSHFLCFPRLEKEQHQQKNCFTLVAVAVVFRKPVNNEIFPVHIRYERTPTRTVSHIHIRGQKYFREYASLLSHDFCIFTSLGE